MGVTDTSQHRGAAVETDVIVIGAGIAGLSQALALADAGLEVVVVEAGPSPGPLASAGRGIALNDWDRRVSALTPSSERFLQSLGAWPLMREQRVGPYDRMSVWDAEGTGHIQFLAEESGVPRLGHIVENRVTVDALLSRAVRARKIDLIWQDGLDAIDHSDPERVGVRLASGDLLSAPLLIGADGARSRVRELEGFQTRAWPYDQSAIVATIELAAPHDGTCFQAFLPSGPLAFLPLAAPTLCSIVWSADTAVAEGLMARTDADFIGALNRAMGGNAPQVSGCGERALFPLRQCHAVDYVQSRVALIADAAHSIHPLAGQGINLGLKDVAILAKAVGRAWGQGLDHGELAVLRRYQRQRKGDNLAMMAAMEGFKRGFGSSNPLIRVARNAGLTMVDGFGPLKHWLAAHALA